MTKETRHIIAVMLLMLACLAISCTDRTEEAAEGSRLQFAVSVADMAEQASTRAPQPVTTLKFDGDVGGRPLYLHFYTDEALGNDGSADTRATAMTTASLPASITVEGVASDGNSVFSGTASKAASWITETQWPRAKSSMRFASLIGSPTSSTKLSCTDGTWTLPTYTFDAVPDEDVLFALSDEYSGSTYQTVDMRFRHIFSSVGVMTRTVEQGIVFESITFKGIADSGTYDAATDKWTLVDGSTRDLTIDLGGQESTGEAYQYLTGREERNIVLPQTFGDDATQTIELKVVADGVEKTLTQSLKNVEWQEGTNMWCVISTSAINWEYTLEVHLDSSTQLTHEGGTVNFTVTSYRTSSSGKVEEAVPWQMTYTDNAMVTSATEYSETGGKVQSVSLAITNAPERSTNNMITKNKERGTSDKPFDLSTNDLSTDNVSVSMTTANCYIVSAPGYYQIPLVRGNAYKNGSLNEAAFNTADGSYSSGNEDDVKIKITNAERAKAKVVRTTVVGSINESDGLAPSIIKGSNGFDYLKFHVTNSIASGNSIIAACDASGNVLWSWHIWFISLSEDDLKPDFLPYNLGWIPDSQYDERSMTVSITQTRGAKKNFDFTVSQSGRTTDNTNSCLYYQWGRKDPFPFATESSLEYEYNNGNQSFANGVLPPETPYYNSYSNEWYYEYTTSYWGYREYTHYSNLWGADDGTTKTIYDPSPAGYRVPTVTEMDDNASTLSLREKGYYYPNYSGGISGTYYWASSWNDNNYREAYDHPYYYGSNKLRYGYSYYAMPIRPVKEK